MVNAVEKTLLRKPRDLLKRIYQLEEEKKKLQNELSKRPSLNNYKTATEYVIYLLKRLDPNKRKTTNLNQEFIKLYEFHFFGRTHEMAVQSIKKDLKWHYLCKADPMLGRLKAVDSFKKKYNKLISQGGGKK
jgi:predicted phage-related endonuclease